MFDRSDTLSDRQERDFDSSAWGYSLHGKTHTISINMAVALTKVRWAYKIR